MYKNLIYLCIVITQHKVEHINNKHYKYPNRYLCKARRLLGGGAYEYLISKFASDADKKAGNAVDSDNFSLMTSIYPDMWTSLKKNPNWILQQCSWKLRSWKEN